jgi:hypothetical protein
MLPSNEQSSCKSIAAGGDNAACASLYGTYKTAGQCQ